nr:hypothetical protein CFP56_70872 [Quercus suber]
MVMGLVSIDVGEAVFMTKRSNALLKEIDAKCDDKDDFGLENCGAVVETFIHEANLITNASFSEVETTADSNIELQ